MRSLIEINAGFIDQALEFLDAEAARYYSESCREVFSTTIGQHIRHCLEHYEELIQALREGREVDYDQRPRDPQVETDVPVARERLQKTRDDLFSLTLSSAPLMVHDAESGEALASSAGRELQFLVSHTVHHYALIAVIASTYGVPTPEDFGIAPSTIRARQSD